MACCARRFAGLMLSPARAFKMLRARRSPRALQAHARAYLPPAEMLLRDAPQSLCVL